MIDSSFKTICDILPHRYPFLMVDRICEATPEKIITNKAVSINEPHFQGHFPNNPVMPGVLILEALFQTGGLYVGLCIQDALKGMTPLLVTVDRVKFRKPVVPGDQLTLTVTPSNQTGVMVHFIGQAHVGEDLAAEAKWLTTLVKS